MAPDTEQLQEFDGTFSYHVGVLVSQSKLYLLGGEAIAGTDEYAAADALFEMLLVRMRTFDSFFSSAQTGKPDDALAGQFVPGWTVAHFLTDDERAQISKRLAHLTYSQPPAHEWAIGQMVKRCLEVIGDFLQSVPGGLTERWAYRYAEVTHFLGDELPNNDLESIWTEADKHAHRR